LLARLFLNLIPPKFSFSLFPSEPPLLTFIPISSAPHPYNFSPLSLPQSHRSITRIPLRVLPQTFPPWARSIFLFHSLFSAAQRYERFGTSADLLLSFQVVHAISHAPPFSRLSPPHPAKWSSFQPLRPSFQHF